MIRRMTWAVVLALACFSASAQETTSGSIAGQVVDTQGAPVPGATVTVMSPQGPKAFVTDANGRFFAPFLTPGKYSVKVELSGFQSVEQKNIDVRLGTRLELPLTLKVGNISETVEVVGASPIVDTSSTTIGGILDSDELKRLPVGRQFTDTLYMVPGVSDSSGVGKANPSIGGSSGLENNYIVDGGNITSTGYGGVGTYSIIFGSLGTGVTTDFIKETQVKTASFEAEYGQATGGVVNVVTKSGTNAFHGSLFGYFRPDSLESEWKQLNTPNGTVNTTGSQNLDFGVAAGGALMKDKLFFFGAFNPQYQTQTFIAPEGFPLRSQGNLDRKRRILSYAGKLTFQATSKHRFDLSAFGDPAHGDSGIQRFTALLAVDTARFSELKTYGGHNQVLRYDGVLSRNWLIEASVANSTNTIEELPSVNEHAFTDTTVVPTRRSGGLGAFDIAQPGSNLQFSLKSTNIFQGGGEHQLRYGASYEDIEFTRELGRTGPNFTLSNGTPTRTGASVTVLPDPVFGRIFRATRANFGPPGITKQRYLSAFAQDTWQIGQKLTLKPGIRYEEQKLVGGDPPLCFANDTRPGRGDGSGQAINCEFTWKNNWAPRLGAVYDIKGDGKSKLYGSWGRFYAKIPNDLAARALSADAGISRGDYFDAGLTRPVPEGTLAAGQTRHLVVAGLHAAEFDPESKSTYQDEFAGGFEVQVLKNMSLGVRYIHRSMPRILEDVGTLQMVAYELGGPGTESVEYFITNVSSKTLVNQIPGLPAASFEDPVHKYDAVELTANKSFSDNWSLIASYRWSKLQGNFEGFYRSDNGQSDPAITSLFDFPTNDPSYTQIGGPRFGYRGDIRFLGCSLGCGVLPNDRTHQLKLFGTYGWNDWNFGFAFNGGSGKSLTNLAANPNYANAGEIPLTKRGEGFQTVDGVKKRTPMEMALDLHADYSLKVGQNKVTLLADIFNIANRQTATNYDNCSDIGFGASNPNFGQPTNGCNSAASSFQPPRAIRLGARFEW